MSVSIAGSQAFPAVNSGAYTIIGATNLLLVFYYETTFSGVTNLTISDTNGNSWNQVVQVFNAAAGHNNAALWWCLTNGTGSTTITCNDDLGINLEPGFIVIEYHNSVGWPANPQDAFATARGQDFPATNSVTKPTLNTSLTDIIVSCIVDINGASYTLLAGIGYVVEVADTNQYAGLQDQLGVGGIGRPAGAYTPGGATLLNSDNQWISIMVGFNLSILPPTVLKNQNFALGARFPHDTSLQSMRRFEFLW